MKTFWTELIKRRVFRTVGAYIGVGYALLLVAQTLEHALVLPTWFDTSVISILVMGLIPVIVLAWVFQFTSEGLVRNKDIPQADISGQDAKIELFDIAAIAITLFIVGVLGLRILSPNVMTSKTERSAEIIDAPEKSIAVLPFEAMSAEQSDLFLGRAVAEETLNRLAKIPELKVSARTSSFALADQDLDIKEIGERLEVAHILEGSIRRSGDRIRITAQLVRTDDGYHIWTETFEPEMADLFLIEDRIVAAISRTLQIRLGVGIGQSKPTGDGIDPAAYEAFLNGKALWSLRMRNNENRFKSFKAFERAVEIDPGFSEAWSALALTGLGSKGSPLSRDKEAFSKKIDQALDRALATNPQNLEALLVAGHWRISEHLDFDGAQDLFERARQIDPKQTELAYAVYWAMTGEPEKALAARDKVAELDPLNFGFLRIRADLQAMIGRDDDALKFYNECQAVNCLQEGFIAFGSTVALLSEDPAEIEKWQKLWHGFHAFIKTLPESELPQVVKVIPAYFATEFGDPNAEQLQQEMIELFKTEPVTDTIGQWGPTFAQFMPPELFIDTLKLAYERGDLFGASFDMLPFYGQKNYPDELLKHPRYHALWEKPGLKELATLRRANGYHHSLPVQDNPASE